ncbi:unnamed protein product [Penicillium salamii]|uniref:Uncharacterized protein n=1 Tax=Penicillium salamii TaxID=1612424 RepID=A0A9W4JFP2_9EURO|nr:unnamed protein product [Penicillium salamii]CAG8236406.1 unnamed protein product [Penicillium salamii]CAG8345176.1 unnamed protein product [Penicillium salamii]CAG8383845.1 unnamed protein product [Penicillium salamii]CAG8387931.1 unnamed protein product [Penicillium salamii]
MDAVARTTQRIAKSCGHLIRIEVARTELHGSPHRPLLAYMDPETISGHVAPWQQILTFFARTQHPTEPAHPAYPYYKFTRRQQDAWDQLWRLATRIPAQSAPHDPYGSDPDCGSRSASPDPYGSDPDRGSPASEPAASPFHFPPLEKACLGFCLELLNQTVRFHERECAMLCVLAVLGGSSTSHSSTSWHTPDSFPPILSKIIKLARFMVLGRALWLDPYAEQIARSLQGWDHDFEVDLQSPLDDPDFCLAHEDEGYQSPSPPPPPSSPTSSSPALLSFSQAARTKKGFHEWVHLIMQTFMVRGTNSPMQSILDLRTYGMRVAFNSTQPGAVGWVGPDRLLYRQLSFTTGELRGWVHSLTQACQDLLSYDILYLSTMTPAPVIPWSTLADDPLEASAGWSFLLDSRTLWPVNGAKWLIDRIRTDPTLRRQFVDPNLQNFRINAIKRYLSRVNLFREKLAILIHLCGGQPARAPEMLSVRHRNTANSHRNVFVEDQQVVIATRYHKGFHVNNDVKLIHRYLPRAVGTVFIQYLWLVLPLVERFDSLVQPEGVTPPTSRTTLLWNQDPFSQRPWTSRRLKEVLQRESRLGLQGQSVNIASWRHIAIALSRRFLRTSSGFPQQSDNQDADENDEDSEEDFQDLQAGHSAHVAGIAYARQLHEAPGSMAHRRLMFRQVSQDWHQFLGFTDPLSPENARDADHAAF